MHPNGQWREGGPHPGPVPHTQADEAPAKGDPTYVFTWDYTWYVSDAIKIGVALTVLTMLLLDKIFVG